MAMAEVTRVLIADDNEHTRDGIRALLATWPDIAVVGEAANGRDAVGMVAECNPDVVLMDMRMPVVNGAEATRLIKQQFPGVAVIVLTMYPTDQADVLDAGADGFLIKGNAPDQLLTALRTAAGSIQS
jgi:DNA-binding NarL/FixJ family response regulator